jgi:hypothetical protein
LKNLFLDCEFVDLGSRVELISIGIAPETVGDPEFYREFLGIGYVLAQKDPWLKENVVPHLGTVDKINNKKLEEDLLNYIGEEEIQFWAYNASYDWVCFCGIFGNLMNLPDNINSCCFDLKQYQHFLRGPVFNQEQKIKHHALGDAKWDRDFYLFLKRYESERLNK